MNNKINGDENIRPYLASILLKGTHITRPSNSPLWQEYVFLIWAINEDAARSEARRIGKQNELEYKVKDGEKNEPDGIIKWTYEFNNVYETEKCILKEGGELFSRFISDGGVSGLVNPHKRNTA